MKINKLLTPYNYNTGTIDRIRYIVIHYVGALGGAQANCRWYAGGNRGASAHYFVDFDGSIWQSVEDKNIAWHCGAKAYRHPECRNANSIGIELCVRNKGSQTDTSHDWYFEDATVEAAIRLTKELMEKYGVSEDHVLRHHDVTGKICPNPYIYNTTLHTWKQFQDEIKKPAPAWIQDGDCWWYRHSDGSYTKNGWEQINGRWYWFNEAGYMISDAWKKADEKWYYLGRDGAMETACLCDIKGEIYAFGRDGAMMEGNVNLCTNDRGALIVS